VQSGLLVEQTLQENNVRGLVGKGRETGPEFK
jgi:hypothetical protein